MFATYQRRQCGQGELSVRLVTIRNPLDSPPHHREFRSALERGAIIERDARGVNRPRSDEPRTTPSRAGEAGMAAVEASVPSFVFPAVDERTIQLLATSLCLVAALLVAALAIALVKRWRRRREAEEDSSPSAQLAHFRSLYEAGTISAEEFERLRALLGGRLRETLGVPAPTAKSPEKPPPQPEPPPPENPDTGIRPA